MPSHTLLVTRYPRTGEIQKAQLEHLENQRQLQQLQPQLQQLANQRQWQQWQAPVTAPAPVLPRPAPKLSKPPLPPPLPGWAAARQLQAANTAKATTMRTQAPAAPSSRCGGRAVLWDGLVTSKCTHTGARVPSHAK
jgi:hypothetical protein